MAILKKIEVIRLIGEIGKKGKELEAQIQEAAVSCVFYSVCYGDVTLAQKLLDSFNAGQRKQALIGFFENYGLFKKEGKTVVHHKNSKLVGADGLGMEGFEEGLRVSGMNEDKELSTKYCEKITKLWSEFNPEKEAPSIYDCTDKIGSFLASMEKKIKSADGKAIHLDAFLAMQEAWNTFLKKEEEVNMKEEENEEMEIPVLKAA